MRDGGWRLANRAEESAGLTGSPRITMCRWMLACALVASAPATAAAQRTAAVMPAVGGDVVEDAREEARSVALEALRAENLVVLEPTRVEVTLDEIQRACLPAAECAAAVRGALGVDLLVGLTISGSQVRASVVDAVGHHLGVADLGEDLGAAVRHSVREAVRESLRAGLERVAEDPALTVEPEVDLSPGAGHGGGASMDWALPVGGVLVGAGVLVAVLPGAIGAATTGCTEMGAAGCVRFDGLDVGAVVGWAIAGSVVAAAGVVLLVVGATSSGATSSGATSSGAGSSGAEASGLEVRARVGLGGLSLEGSF